MLTAPASRARAQWGRDKFFGIFAKQASSMIFEMRPTARSDDAFGCLLRLP
jgi:hypothetical protein